MKIKAIINILVICAVSLNCSLAFGQGPKYRVQPTDVLNITVYQNSDLTTRTRVTADGFITFPLIGKVNIANLTVPDVEQKLKELLENDYLVNAQVSVFVAEYHPRQFSVMGEVEKPGKYDMPAEKELTVMEAIAMAEGFTKDAASNATKIIRTKDGKKETIRVRVNDITSKGDKNIDIALEPGDIVYVPESFF